MKKPPNLQGMILLSLPHNTVTGNQPKDLVGNVLTGSPILRFFLFAVTVTILTRLEEYLERESQTS